MKEQQENDPVQRERCQAERRRLGVGSVSTTVGDGAKWIWNLTQKVFGKTEECLDIFHALEHISDCGKGLYGVLEEADIWLERRLKQTGACWRVDRVNKMASIVAALYTRQPIRQGKIPTKV